MSKIILTSIFTCAISLYLQGQSVLWNDIAVPNSATQELLSEPYRTMSVNLESLKADIQLASAEKTTILNPGISIQLPTPDGGSASFKIVEKTESNPEIKVRDSQFHRYIGVGTGNYANAEISLSISTKSFNAKILMEGKSYSIDPLSSKNTNVYKVYYNNSISDDNLGSAFDDPPLNDNPCGAIQLHCGENLSGGTYYATVSTLGEPFCGYTGESSDVFYKFSTTVGSTYTITVAGNYEYDAVIVLYSGYCSSLTIIDCVDNVHFSGPETVVYTATENEQIYIRTYDYFWSDDSGDGGAFTITMECESPNENPCNAQLLTCGELVNGSTVGAAESTLPNPSCSSGSKKDLFYKINALSGVEYTVSVNGSNYDGVLSAYTGICDGTLTEIDCSDNGIGNNLAETINFSVTSNRPVLIRTYDYYPSGGDFQLTVSCANVPNDEPCDARTLLCGESFTGSSSGATLSSIGNPSCANGSQKDVFFKFTAFANVEYTVTVNGDNYDGVLAAYTGSCSGTLTEIDCSDMGVTPGVAETVTIEVATDQVITLQTYDYSSSGQSDFTITLNCPIPDNDDCADAETLSVNNPGSCPANQTLGTTVGASPSDPNACEPGTPDVYYKFNSGNNSEVIINLNNINAGDLVLSVFKSSCSSAAIYCNIDLSQSPTISVTPFTTYYVRVHSLSANWTGSFNICIEKPAPEIATVNGTISGWNTNCASRNVKVSFYNTSTSTTYIVNTTLSTAGTFVANSVAIPSGTYHILVKLQGALAVLTEDVVLNGGANSFSIGPVQLGDINNNNIINLLDFSGLSPAFGTSTGVPGYNILADLNCDGIINLIDVSILASGFNLVGDTLP